MRITPENIQSLGQNEIFVFGSNQAGRHGKGAAKLAMQWGATYGLPEGLSGRTYAIPTKNATISKALSQHQIKVYVDRFIQIATLRSDLHFLVTEIGCGLAGKTPQEIAPLFAPVQQLDNVSLPKRFIDVLTQPKLRRTANNKPLF